MLLALYGLYYYSYLSVLHNMYCIVGKIIGS